MTDDQVQAYLRENDYPEHVIRNGRAGLVRQWREFVEQAEAGYNLGLEDYRNDLDVRGILRQAEAEDTEIEALDDRFRKLLIAADRRVWESVPGNPFWDFGYPANAGRELRNGLREEGLLED
jgi:hypothetical protein